MVSSFHNSYAKCISGFFPSRMLYVPVHHNVFYFISVYLVFSLVENPEGKRRIGRPSGTWEDDNKMEVEGKGARTWIGFIWLKIRWSVLSNVINIWLRNIQEILCQATEDKYCFMTLKRSPTVHHLLPLSSI